MTIHTIAELRQKLVILFFKLTQLHIMAVRGRLSAWMNFKLL
jgi:hypothetical protein